MCTDSFVRATLGADTPIMSAIFVTLPVLGGEFGVESESGLTDLVGPPPVQNHALRRNYIYPRIVYGKNMGSKRFPSNKIARRRRFKPRWLKEELRMEDPAERGAVATR